MTAPSFSSGTELQCVILAGGLGTRMHPHTSVLPKCLLPVAGRPFADWQLEWLASEGVTRVVYCIGHLGDYVRAHVGDGSAWALHVTYVDEGPSLLGTAGALRLALDSDVLDEEFFVIYGDSYLSVSLSAVATAFRSSGCPALMTVFRNEGNWEESNVVFDRDRVLRYQKHPGEPPLGMDYVDYGLSVLRADLVADTVVTGTPVDLAGVFERLSLEGRLAGYEVKERFYEIGSPDGLRALETHLAIDQQPTSDESKRR
jgi:MurNAc alpha-1-phosphate uridylyltransferase